MTPEKRKARILSWLKLIDDLPGDPRRDREFRRKLRAELDGLTVNSLVKMSAPRNLNCLREARK